MTAAAASPTPSMEEALLGGLLAAADPALVREAIAIARPSDFADPLLARITQALADLAERGDPIDAPTLHAALSRESSVDGRRAAVRVAELMDLEATGANAVHHARAVRRDALERRERLLAQRLVEPSTTSELRERAREEMAQIARELSAPRSTDPACFEALHEGAYRMTVPSAAAVLELDFLRRDGAQLKGELLVRCDLAGARTFDGVLSITDLNLSAARTRKEHARYLEERSRASGVDWIGIVEEFAQRVLTAEREGAPAVDLVDVPCPEPESALDFRGLRLLRRHPLVLFGDGGTFKSYLMLWILGELARRGLRVLFADWELAAEDHRERLGRLFGDALPRIQYVRCTRPLVYEAERLRRVVREQRIEYAAFDSIGFACDGPPEAAEVAGRYFQALRQLGPIGSIHGAHVAKALEGADLKPFGSAFWHNGFRSTWNMKRDDDDGDRFVVGLYHRKANVGARLPAVGFAIDFSGDRTRIEPADLVEGPQELAASLPLKQRMREVLKRGAMTRKELAELLGAKQESVRQAIHRSPRLFRVLQGGLVGLAES